MVVISSRLETKMKSELEDWPKKIVQTEAIKEKKNGWRKEELFIDFCLNIKRPNISVMET